MAFATYDDHFEARPLARPSWSLRRWMMDLIVGRDMSEDSNHSLYDARMARKLAGPDPKDAGASGYMADLDIEVGF